MTAQPKAGSSKRLWRRWIGEPVFRQGFTLVIGERDAFDRMMKRRYGLAKWDKALNGAHITFTDPKTRQFDSYIWLPAWTGTPDELCTLAHEGVHYVAAVLKHAHCKDEEASAYYLSWFLREALARLRAYGTAQVPQVRRGVSPRRRRARARAKR